MQVQRFMLIPACSHTSKWSHTLTVTCQGAINLDRADERGSRGYGESVRVGVAVTLTGLGGLMCLSNTLSDVENGTVFPHLREMMQIVCKDQ